MNRITKIAHCCLFLFLLGCASNGVADDGQNEESWTSADQATEEALAAGDYKSAIDVVLKQAEGGNPEMQFWVGYLYLEWLDDPEPKEPPSHTAKDALAWIYMAASAGVPQAASTLRNGYEWGRFKLPKNPVLENCWHEVEIGDQKADVCLAAEARVGK
jgi:TPR repeat protein